MRARTLAHWQRGGLLAAALRSAGAQAACASLPQGHCCLQEPFPLLAGLDKNDYDRSKCQEFFDAYKDCKKEEVRSAQRAGGRLLRAGCCGRPAATGGRPGAAMPSRG